LMFECVHAMDPHIVAEEPGLYFIGQRDHRIEDTPILMNTLDESYFWEFTGVKIVEAGLNYFSTVKELAKAAKHEGYVFHSVDGDYRCSKIKSPYYLTKKFLMRGNWEKFLNKRKDLLDEEFYGLYHYIYEVERERFFELDEIARREYIENFFEKLT